jgi:methylenetetrahydrofolate--tRNA-(uracil-5-)-methyltransferase
LYNLVGFQTNLAYAEQQRVFRMIPGLEGARFARYGQMHRNTFLNSPRLLKATLQHRQRQGLLFAGQITGVEGYLGNIATGLLAGVNAARIAGGSPPIELPADTMLGALLRYVTQADPERFQPMKANLGLLSPVGARIPRRERGARKGERAVEALAKVWAEAGGHQLRIAIE